MPLLIDLGAKYRKDNENIEKIASPYKEEIISLNERIKKLNLEQDNLHNRFFSGLKKVINSRKEISINKDEFVSKYNLIELLKEIDLYVPFKNEYKNEFKKIDLMSINRAYDFITYTLYNCMRLVEQIYNYKLCNYDINKLYEMSKKEDYFDFISNLNCNIEEEYLNMINNEEIKDIGKKLSVECLKIIEEIEKYEEEIDTLEEKIKDRFSSNKKNSLNELIQYKEILERMSKLLPTEDEQSKNIKNK